MPGEPVQLNDVFPALVGRYPKVGVRGRAVVVPREMPAAGAAEDLAEVAQLHTGYVLPNQPP
ncbi:hypothetical protein ABIB27_003434 [Arthrobacter sp. UYEF21]